MDADQAVKQITELQQQRNAAKPSSSASSPSPTSVSQSLPALQARLADLQSRANQPRPASERGWMSMEERYAQERQERMVAETRWPARHASMAYAGVTWPDAEKWGAAQDCVGTGGICCLIGSRGPGKTQMGVCLMHEFIESGRSAQYWTAADLFDYLRSLFEIKGVEAERKRQELYRRKLLVIDEIQDRGETDFEDRELRRLIDKRYGNGLATVLIGNLSATEFQRIAGPSIVSRLSEIGTVIICDWPSFR